MSESRKNHKRGATEYDLKNIEKRISKLKETTTVTRTSITKGMGFRASNAL